ncbi:MAG: hypothetical protein ACO21B_02575, partial [Gemmobacter sp.]
VYEAQRDWRAAVTIAEQLVTLAAAGEPSAAGHGQPAQLLRGHYLCEQAELALERSDADGTVFAIRLPKDVAAAGG